MSSVQPLIPAITDQDIDWVSHLIGLEALDEARREFLKTRSTVDVSACPGSGKTTLIVAKLAILAQEWPHRAKGICILSHTNVAREAIQRKLSGTVVGQRLLNYPHFIGTIHGFVNRFLALPWLYSNGFPIVAIDDDVTTAYRRRVLGEKNYWKVQNFLKQKHNDFGNLRITGRDFSFDLKKTAFPAGENADSFRLARQAVEASAKAGYFCFNEVFVWAEALLKDYPQAPSWLACRFPLVVIDEMQDTSDRQGAILNAVFSRQSEEIVVQRVGDPNQAIFDAAEMDGDQSDPFPDQKTGYRINISDSFRFGQQIATLASPFAVQVVSPTGLCGVGPKGSNTSLLVPAHAIFLFPDNRTDGVLDAFGNHVLSVLPDGLLERGLVKAVGAVHRDASDVSPGHAHFPKTVGHYWAGYRAEISRKDANPQAFIQYIWLAQALARQGTELYPAVQKLASGFIRLADLLGDIDSLKRKTRTHRAITDALIELPQVSLRYQKTIRTLLIDHFCLTEVTWPSARKAFIQVASALCKGQVNPTGGDTFLAWSEEAPPEGLTNGTRVNAPGINVYRVTMENRHVDIHLGSIHSVKGQDHLATLILNT